MYLDRILCQVHRSLSTVFVVVVLSISFNLIGIHLTPLQTTVDPILTNSARLILNTHPNTTRTSAGENPEWFSYFANQPITQVFAVVRWY